MADRTKILSTLAAERAELELRYRGFDPEVVGRPCTESESENGEPWTPKDHLAHLLRIEEAFLQIAERTVGGHEKPLDFGATEPDDVIKKVHDDNESHVRGLAERSVDELLDRLAVARSATLAFIDTLDDEQLTQTIPGAPWGDGSIGGVLMANAGHEKMHLHWVDEGLADTV